MMADERLDFFLLLIFKGFSTVFVVVCFGWAERGKLISFFLSTKKAVILIGALPLRATTATACFFSFDGVDGCHGFDFGLK